ncbi:MAG TPA: hypothetical protein VGE77_13970 [Nocardioides sp.]
MRHRRKFAAVATAVAFDGELTEPSSTLAIGDTATVPFSYAGDDGVIEVTVTGIRAGDPADIADIDGAEGQTPYHISYEITGVDNVEGLAGMQLNLDGLTAAGDGAAQLVSFTGGIGGCETESADSDWDGGTFETCNTVVAPEPVTQVAFAEGEDYSLWSGTQILWS